MSYYIPTRKHHMQKPDFPVYLTEAGWNLLLECRSNAQFITRFRDISGRLAPLLTATNILRWAYENEFISHLNQEDAAAQVQDYMRELDLLVTAIREDVESPSPKALEILEGADESLTHIQAILPVRATQ